VNAVRFITTTLLLVLHVAMLFLAVDTDRAKPTRPRGLLLLACISYTLAQLGWFSFGFVAGFFHITLSASTKAILLSWQVYSIRAFNAAFLLLMICAFRAMKQPPAAVAKEPI
jgi:uncharacterized membrane protein